MSKYSLYSFDRLGQGDYMRFTEPETFTKIRTAASQFGKRNGITLSCRTQINGELFVSNGQITATEPINSQAKSGPPDWDKDRVSHETPKLPPAPAEQNRPGRPSKMDNKQPITTAIADQPSIVGKEVHRAPTYEQWWAMLHTKVPLCTKPFPKDPEDMLAIDYEYKPIYDTLIAYTKRAMEESKEFDFVAVELYKKLQVSKYLKFEQAPPPVSRYNFFGEGDDDSNQQGQASTATDGATEVRIPSMVWRDSVSEGDDGDDDTGGTEDDGGTSTGSLLSEPAVRRPATSDEPGNRPLAPGVRSGPRPAPTPVSPANDGWTGRACPICGRSGVVGGLQCSACGGAGEEYIAALDERTKQPAFIAPVAADPSTLTNIAAFIERHANDRDKDNEKREQYH